MYTVDVLSARNTVQMDFYFIDVRMQKS